MADDIQFETPENVKLSYRLAGPGTRFVAWMMDIILLFILVFVLLIVALLAGASLDILQRSYGERSQSVVIFLALVWLSFSLGSFLYFGACELLLRGQTIGKRSMRIRVVKADGFALDPAAIFLRTIFRLIDQMPIFFIVPVVTAKGQRFGDMVAGTLVIADEQPTIGDLRDHLTALSAAERKFQFDAAALKRARPQDMLAVEKLLERWSKLTDAERQALLQRIVPPLAARLEVECPPPEDWPVFLRDLLAAEFRRQHRQLG